MRIIQNIKLLKPYTLYLLLAAIAFFPCLFLGQAYWANDLLYQFGPFRQLLKEQILSGHFPLWNPFIFGGQPYFANPNAMACYLPNYLTLFFPLGFGMSLFFFLHMALAGAGMHWWLKTLRLSANATRVGAFTYALSGFFWWELIHLHILAEYALFPLLMVFIEKLRQNWAPRWAFGAGAVFGLIFCCGSFQSTSWIFYTALFYALFRFFTWENPDSAAPKGLPWKKLGLVLLFAFWGGLPLFTHLIPAKEFSDRSNRESKQPYENFAGTFSMKPSTTYEFLFPTLTLPPGQTIETAIQAISDQQNVGNDFLANFGYIGIWLPFFFVLAFRRKDKKNLVFMTLMGVFSVLTAWGRFFPLHQFLCNYLPTIDLSRAPFRFVQSYVLFGCVLLAYGFQTLERKLDEEKNNLGLILGALGYALFFLVIAFSRPDQTWREILALALGSLGLTIWEMTHSWKNLGRWTLMTALVLPLLLSGWNDFKTDTATNYNFEENYPPFSRFHQLSPENRFYFDPSMRFPVKVGDREYGIPFPENLTIAEKLRDGSGYSPIVLTANTDLHHLFIEKQMALMNINNLLFQHDQGEQPGYIHEDLKYAQLYTRTGPSHYVTAPADIEVVPDHESLIRSMSLPDFDPARQAFFEEKLPAPLSTQLPKTPVKLSFKLNGETLDSQDFELQLDRNSWVVFSEMAFPGWKAWIDGQPADIHTANDAFRALFVHAGHHQVQFKYEPLWFYPLLGLFFLWTLSALFYVMWLYASKEPQAAA